MSWLIAAIVVTWLACGVLAHGFTMGYWVHAYPEARHNFWAIIISLLAGPLDLIATLAFCGFRYWAWTELPKEERWKHFKARFGNLGRDSFERRDI